MNPKPDFNADLKRGKAAERWFADHVGLQLAPDGERRWDLQSSEYGRIELKCDSHDPASSPNFFMELRTRIAGGGTLLGGPWRALEDDVDTFVYMFHRVDAPPSVAFWFEDLPKLVQHLDFHHAEGHYETRRVRAGKLQAVGLLVPRQSLIDLFRVELYG